MQKIRKALIVSVMMMTVFSLSVVVAPSADAVANGDVIKMDGLSSVYYVADGKRYVFPNEATYFSWYPDFSNVMAVAQSELELYPLAANVTMRPGTKLITSPSNSMVYAVEPGGVLRSIVSEENAINLFGADWAVTVVDVIDAFFTNYTLGTPLTVGTYPTGSIIKTADSADVYYVEDGKARKFADEAAFVNNRFVFDNVKTAAALPTTGTDVTGVEVAMTDTSSGAGGTPNAGSGLTVSVAGDTAPSRNVPSKSTLVPFVTVNLTAASDGDVRVDGLTLTRRGTGNTAQFSGGYLYIGDERLTNSRSVNSSEHTIAFSALNLTIPAGMTKQITLKMDDSVSDAGTGNHYFAVNTASDVVTNGATVSGSFPLEGNMMTYSSVEAATVTFTGSVNNANRKVGETNVILGEFDIANNNQEVVNISRIRLKHGGTATNDAVNNISLDIDGTIVAEGLAMVDKYVDFMLDTPLSLDKSKTVTATIRGDVQEDIDKTIYFYLKNTADVDVRGSSYGDFYSSQITRTLFDDSAGSESTTITVKGSEINVSFDGPQAADVKDDLKDVVFASFKIKSENQDVNFDVLRVVLAMVTASGTASLDNVELVDSANNASYSISDPDGSSANQDLDFENVYIQKGIQYTFEIRGDIPDGTTAGQTYAVSINFASGQTANYQDSDETSVSLGDYSASSLTGKTMTVAAPSLTVSKVTTNSVSAVKNATGVLLYKGKLTASNVDDLKLTKLPIDSDNGHDDAGDFDADWNRLYLYRVNSDGTETELDDETSLGGDTVNFSGFTLDIPKGSSNGILFVVRGNVKNTPTGTTTKVKVVSAASWTVKDSDNNTVTPTVLSTTVSHTTTVTTKGTYTLAFNNDEVGLNNPKNVLAGEMSLVGRIKLTASKEVAILEDLVIQNQGDATNATLATLYLYDNKEMSGTALGSADFAAGANPKALFEDVNIEIPTTGSTYLYIGAAVKGIDYSADPGADATAVAGATSWLRIPTDATGYATKAMGKNTGEELTDAHSADVYTSTSTVMGAVVTALATDFADKTLSAGTKDIFSFKVTVPTSGNIDYNSDDLAAQLGTVTFTIATSNASVSAIKVERVGGANGEKTVAAAPASGLFAIDFKTTYGTDSDLKMKPGETVEYVVRGLISGVSTSASIDVSIESAFSANVPYDHFTTDGSTYATDVYPLISGTTYVRGGTLTN